MVGRGRLPLVRTGSPGSGSAWTLRCSGCWGSRTGTLALRGRVIRRRRRFLSAARVRVREAYPQGPCLLGVGSSCPRAGQLTGSWCLCAHSEATVPARTDFLTGTHFTRQDGRTPTSPNSPRCLPKTTVGPGPALWANVLLHGPREGPGERTSSTCVPSAWTPLKHRVPLRWPRAPRGSLVTGGS